MEDLQALLEAYLEETSREERDRLVKPLNYVAGRRILGLPPETQIMVVHHLMAQMVVYHELMTQQLRQAGQDFGGEQHPGNWRTTSTICWRLDGLRGQLFTRHLPYTDQDLERLLQSVERETEIGYDRSLSWGNYGSLSSAILKNVVRCRQGRGLTPAMQASLQAAQGNLRILCAGDMDRVKETIDEVLGTSARGEPDPGERWADSVRLELAAMMPERRQAWCAIIAHAASASAAKPTAGWLKQADKNREVVGDQEFSERMSAWLRKAGPPPRATEAEPQLPQLDYTMREVFESPEYLEYSRTRQEYNKRHFRVSEKNISILKGFAWYSALLADAELARGVGRLAVAGYENVPLFGVWAKSAGNAAIWALGRMPRGAGVGPLARLRTQLRDRNALKMIAESIASAAKNAGMTVDELEDLAVPTGGLDADGTRRETFGEDGAATLTLDAKTAKTNLRWFGPDGKPRKAIPAAVKKNYPAEVKALKATEDEIKQTLAAQAARFDKFLLDEREWPLSVWQERYLAHPILGNLARRLIWVKDDVPFLPDDLDTQNCQNEPPPASPAPPSGAVAPELGAGGPPPSPGTGEVARNEPEGVPTLEGPSSVRLWHPLNAAPGDVLHWRETLESRGMVQPFKQAHREVYLLTDAERATQTYSNRFAAHILKQHQLNSLCALRGWKNKLRLMVDDEYPPATRELPQHTLRAEFWVEGIGDNYGVDTNETGTYLRLTTDQVRFYRLDAPTHHAHAYGGGYGTTWRQAPAEAVPLEEVPPLVFSEVMRDVDLFVGVASVGNDPTWADGGPQGRFRDYWQDYAFGDLTETAKTRGDVLARLLPRLKIAGRCRLDGRFLIVRGDLRTYKIHLGSGNILMEPNDQYLCIVPGSRADDGQDLFLPFEGDRTLAVILSKAFLLADDTHIADPSITRQIQVE